ncbi:MAG: APC family permease, partial [Candidatus Cloacimonadales bacterium]
MSKLKKELKLYELFSIAAGAMISSGLFILPGLAYAKSGTLVIVAYFLAGILVIPTIFSKAELSTAMPRSGGTYYFVGRSLGQAMGSLGGMSAWFSLSFKSAFALLGIGAFAGIIFPEIHMWEIKLVALFFCLFFTAVNLFSVSHSGKIQSIMVGSLILLLLLFTAFGLKSIVLENYTLRSDVNINTVFITAGMIFISFGGVTKIADVAEEAKNPNRDIPLSMLLAFFVVTTLYIAVIFVTVGVLGTELGTLEKYSLTPISDAANVFWGFPGRIILGIAALLAFISTANAGIMAASPPPLGMSRAKVLRKFFSKIQPKYQTPQNSIYFTSTFMILVILLPL